MDAVSRNRRRFLEERGPSLRFLAQAVCVWIAICLPPNIVVFTMLLAGNDNNNSNGNHVAAPHHHHNNNNNEAANVTCQPLLSAHNESDLLSLRDEICNRTAADDGHSLDAVIGLLETLCVDADGVSFSAVNMSVVREMCEQATAGTVVAENAFSPIEPTFPCYENMSDYKVGTN